MGLYSECTKCKKRINDDSMEERMGYPKTALTLLKEGGKIENVELCVDCRAKLVEWLRGEEK